MEVADVERALTNRLDGAVTRLSIDPVSHSISGYLIHPSFDGQSHLDRQRRLWNWLRDRFGGASREIGLIAALTPEEWNAAQEVAEEIE